MFLFLVIFSLCFVMYDNVPWCSFHRQRLNKLKLISLLNSEGGGGGGGGEREDDCHMK